MGESRVVLEMSYCAIAKEALQSPPHFNTTQEAKDERLNSTVVCLYCLYITFHYSPPHFNTTQEAKDERLNSTVVCLYCLYITFHYSPHSLLAHSLLAHSPSLRTLHRQAL